MYPMSQPWSENCRIIARNPHAAYVKYVGDSELEAHVCLKQVVGLLPGQYVYYICIIYNLLWDCLARGQCLFYVWVYPVALELCPNIISNWIRLFGATEIKNSLLGLFDKSMVIFLVMGIHPITTLLKKNTHSTVCYKLLHPYVVRGGLFFWSYRRTFLERPPQWPCKYGLNIGGLWWQVQVRWTTGPSARSTRMWSLKTCFSWECSQDRFHCTKHWKYCLGIPGKRF